MGENELYQIAFHFREAIVAAKTNREFNFRDRMHGLLPMIELLLISREISSVEHGNQFMLDRKLELTKN